MAELLDELLTRIGSMAPEEKKALLAKTKPILQSLKFIPNPGPQTLLFCTQADITLYGGQGGGGKSAGLIGLAMTQHERTLILRRRYTDLGAILDESKKFNGTSDGFKGSPPPRLTTTDGRIIDYGAAKKVGDEQHWQGNPHDLIGVDEAAQFAESQIRFLMGWNRSTNPGQRCRTVLASNPPLNSEGLWLIEWFAPWLKKDHPNPARPGELRWYITDPDGKDLEVANNEPLEIAGKIYRPKSRTFIPASLKDNPFLANTDYQATLDSLPEPLRSAIRDGNFTASRKDALDQIIPTAWIEAAMQRWTAAPAPGVPMCALAVDVAQGGDDNTVLSARHDSWFAPLLVVPGKETPTGSSIAALVVRERRDGAAVIIDMGGGWGGSAYERLEDNEIHPLIGYKGNDGANAKTRDRRLSFYNKRSQDHWRMREALDPDQPGGSTIMLPPDEMLKAELAATCFTVGTRGIQAESKDDVIDKLGRSPDRGDSVIMCWADGRKSAVDGTLSRSSGPRRRPNLVLGYPNRRR